jgi:hypothetical protein
VRAATQAEAFVVPVYADFLGKFAALPFSTHREKYLVYARPEDLAAAITRRFLGHS